MKIKVEFWSVVQPGAQNPEPSEGLRVLRPERQEPAPPSPAAPERRTARALSGAPGRSVRLRPAKCLHSIWHSF